MIAKIVKKAINDLDVTLATLGIIIAITLIAFTPVLANLNYASVGVIVLLACFAYLLLRKKGAAVNEEERPKPRTLYLAFNVLFFLVFLISILILYLRPNPYIRPTGYFVSVSVMAGILAAEILFLPQKKPYSYLTLVKIIIIALSLVYSQMLLFPTVIGDDSFGHQRMTQDIISSGFLPNIRGYARMPVLHLVAGSTSLVTGLDFRLSALLSITTVNILCLILFTFLVGRMVFNEKVGLLAALVLGTSVDFIGMSHLTMPNTFGGFMILVIVYILLKRAANPSNTYVIPLLLFMVTVILTHSLVSMCVAILIFAYWFGNIIYGKIRQKSISLVKLNTFFIFFTGMFAWWIYASGNLEYFVDLIKSGFNIDFLFMNATVYQNITQYTHTVPLVESAYNSLGRYLYIGLAIPGCLYILSRKESQPKAFALSFGALVITTIIFVASIFSIQIFTGRWHYLVQIILAIPVAITIIILIGKIRSGLGKATVTSCIVGLAAFIMISTPISNMDNPIFKDTLVRKAYFQSELQARDTLALLNEQSPNKEAEPIKTDIGVFYARDFSGYRGSVFYFDRKLADETITVEINSYIKLDYEPALLLSQEGFSRVYDCGTVYAFYSPPETK